MAYTLEEVSYLLDHAADIEATAQLLSNNPADALADAGIVRKRHGEYARAVHELIQARHKAQTKLPKDMLMCHDSGQQATHWAIALVRAARLAAFAPAATVMDVTSSIGTEGLAIRQWNANLSHWLSQDFWPADAGAAPGAAEAGETDAHGSFDGRWINGDLDPARAAMAWRNNGFPTVVADALTPVAPSAQVVIADPARRAGGRRIVSPEDLLPPLSSLLGTYPDRAVAIKCAPGLDFSDWSGLVSVASVDGGVKEACLYSPELADGITREAVVVRTRSGEPFGADAVVAIDRISDAPELRAGADEVPVAPAGRYLIDPDGAIVRAGLVRHFAAREGLWQLDPHIAYLTGDTIPAGYSGFEVIGEFTRKQLPAAVREHGFSQLEILIRGVEENPDALRAQLLKKAGSGKKDRGKKGGAKKDRGNKGGAKKGVATEDVTTMHSAVTDGASVEPATGLAGTHGADSSPGAGGVAAGPRAGAVVLTRVGDKHVAFLCHARQHVAR